MIVELYLDIFDNDDFVYFESKLKNDVSLLKGSKGRKYFEFELTEYPNFNFKISGSFYDGILDDDEFIKTFKKGVIITNKKQSKSILY